MPQHQPHVWSSREASEGGAKARVGCMRRRQLRAKHQCHGVAWRGVQDSKPEVGDHRGKEEGFRDRRSE